MKSKFRSCCERPGRSGLTLIEVVVGLVLLATLFVGVMIGFRRHVWQVQRARQRLDAIELADRLLADWFLSPERLPSEASGAVPGNESLTWHTQVIDTSLVDTVGAQIVRLAIRGGDASAAPLVAVDLLVPVFYESKHRRGE